MELKKTLSCWDATTIVIGIMVGIGIFRVPSVVASYLAHPLLILLAWLLGGVISLAGVLCYMELSSSFPETGGNYIYLREAYGLLPAFLFGWAEFFVIRTGSIASVAYLFAEYLISFLALKPSRVKLIAVLVIFLLSFMNLSSIRFGKRSQNVLTLLKILALVVIIFLGLFSHKGSLSNFSFSSSQTDRWIVSSFASALIPILWTYGGWHESSFIAGETEDAKRSIPLSLLMGILIVTVFYLGVNLTYFYLMPIERLRTSTLIGSDLMRLLCGKPGQKILEALVVVFSLGSINAMIIAGSRVTYALAQDHAVFRYFGEVDQQRHTPARAMMVNGLWSIVLALWGNFEKLLFFTGGMVWLFFGITGLALFRLRYKYPTRERAFECLGYPFTPIFFIGICTLLFVNTFLTYPLPTFFGACLAGSGGVVFLTLRTKRLLPRQEIHN